MRKYAAPDREYSSITPWAQPSGQIRQTDRMAALTTSLIKLRKANSYNI